MLIFSTSIPLKQGVRTTYFSKVLGHLIFSPREILPPCGRSLSCQFAGANFFFNLKIIQRVV